MIDFANILNRLHPISLQGMNAVELLNRKDTKFLFNINELPGILDDLANDYYILEVNNQRLISYFNYYFDTHDFTFYFQHHNGRMNRHKMRIRQYADSGICYFEIKFKTNTGRTIKTRIKLKAFLPEITEEIAEFIRKQTPVDPDSLQVNCKIDFKRITLVEKNYRERATIDTSLTLSHGDAQHYHKTTAIAELKQDRTASGSRFREIMRNHFARELRISKYCIGVSGLYPELKRNKFKPRHLAIQKIEKTALNIWTN